MPGHKGNKKRYPGPTKDCAKLVFKSFFIISEKRFFFSKMSIKKVFEVFFLYS